MPNRQIGFCGAYTPHMHKGFIQGMVHAAPPRWLHVRPAVGGWFTAHEGQHLEQVPTKDGRTSNRVYTSTQLTACRRPPKTPNDGSQQRAEQAKGKRRRRQRQDSARTDDDKVMKALISFGRSVTMRVQSDLRQISTDKYRERQMSNQTDAKETKEAHKATLIAPRTSSDKGWQNE